MINFYYLHCERKKLNLKKCVFDDTAPNKRIKNSCGSRCVICTRFYGNKLPFYTILNFQENVFNFTFTNV